jgi:hypothetical protein
MEISISVKLDEAEEKINKILNRVTIKGESDREDLKQAFQETMFEDLSKRFASSPSTVKGGMVYGGQYWKHLSEFYLQMNRKRLNGVIHVDSGALKQSLVSMTEDTISEMDGKTFNFGTSLPYAEKLQETRPIVFLHEDLLTELTNSYEKFLIGN